MGQIAKAKGFVTRQLLNLVSSRMTLAAIASSLILSSEVSPGRPLPFAETLASSTRPVSTQLFLGQPALANTSGGRLQGGSFGEDEPRSNSGQRRTNSSENDSQPLNFYSFVILLIILGMMYRSGKLAEIMQTSGLSEPVANTPAKRNVQTFKTDTDQTTTYQLTAETSAPRPVARANPAPAPRSSRLATKRFSRELTNNIVTVTQVQVALLASARHVQTRLNQLAATTDVSTSKGLTKSLRETVVALLRSPELWTHVSAQSQTHRSRKAATEWFEALSLEARSKFEAETLVNVGGHVTHHQPTTATNELADYIVVTLIIGSAHDTPLINRLRSTEDLREALKTLGSMPPEYLMVYEVLWSPQAENDSLTDEELLLNYPHMAELL